MSGPSRTSPAAVPSEPSSDPSPVALAPSYASSRWAIAALVGANLVPLAGVALFGWRLSDVMILYWLENGVIGAFTLLRILTVAGSDNAVAAALSGVGKLFRTGFFIFHYGIFWTVHGIFVVEFFGPQGAPTPTGFPNPFDTFLAAGGAPVLGWALLALALSHGTSFVVDWFGRGEYRGATSDAVMMQPYGRVVILHVTILLGGFAAMAFGQPLAALLLLVALKIATDLAAHLREHAKAQRHVGKPRRVAEIPSDAA